MTKYRVLILIAISFALIGCATTGKNNGCVSNKECGVGFSCRTLAVQAFPASVCKPIGWTQPNQKETISTDAPPIPESLRYLDQPKTKEVTDLNQLTPDNPSTLTNKPIKSSSGVNLEPFKTQCKQLGFKIGTTDFGNCVLELNDAK